MVLLWICLPLGLLAIGWSVGVVLLPSIRERRLRRAQRVIEGEEAADDKATTLAVEMDPRAAGHAHRRVRDHAKHRAGLPPSSTRVERTPDDRALLLSIDEDADDEAIRRLRRELERDPVFGDVREVDGTRDDTGT